ncbi:site-specific integrase [Halomicroarcula sp. S1AR25-4]|uniref:tyrosine-type recombinase/integrase n=1 Tax=Haloarcula sp. S1AR25-4 TaxID=2950538 RepID=UPI002874F16F|nr:site-specific integrase [Halomicroarcula sp. S1AR25-4]MDS0278030.1 site-specific integrase [Halomicroarcula sp. S1AR25-4]
MKRNKRMNRNEKGQYQGKYDLEKHEDLYELYSEWVLLNTEKTTTIDRLQAGVRLWLYWCENNDVDPLTASENDVRRYIKWNRVNNFAPTTITRRVASVSKYYHHLKNDPDAEWNLDRNPTAGIDLRKDYKIKNTSEYVTVLHREERQDIMAVQPESVAKLVDFVPGDRPETRTRNELIVRLLWQTACRADELSRIHHSNIDWKNREIRIRSSKLNLEDHPDLYHRRIWWEPSLDLLMRRWYESHRSRFSKYAGENSIEEDDESEEYDDDDSSYLFVTTHGPQMDPGTISRIVKDAAHNAGIQEPLVKDADGTVRQWLYTSHRLRHSRITWLANYAFNGEGMDLNALRMTAGHAKFDTTLDYVMSDWDVARARYEKAVREDNLPV